MSDLNGACPCGHPQSYAACCGRYHRTFTETGTLSAPTAEALMRSRYSAFVRDQLSYLLATWHPRTRPDRLSPNEPGLRWLGLEVHRHTQLDATHAEVHFVARSKLGGRAHRLVETSRFERVDGVWLYVDGDLS
ncbi:SEC-C motif-containing protein [Inhella inkyongensis]|uniref:UPF0225 protein HNQ51_001553 n=1 Tax=Inhella inkyongensis TaxID=392593 RepID=A0A840S704_9BURK|nr:YchJ family metal-binding protein [Inhella inkyongensis]MBB5204239.1 SEC-C motif-containing protein [Inhella inkyongensis]